MPGVIDANPPAEEKRMSKIIRNGEVVDDAWSVLTLADGEIPESVIVPEGNTLVPLAVWQAQRAALIEPAAPRGVWLDSHEKPEDLVDDLARLAVVGVHFPKFADGRVYSIGRLLRERFGFTGELRAIGDVLHDQLHYLRRCGFNAYALRADKDPYAALAGLRVFSESYQVSVDQPQPLFRRRDRNVLTGGAA